MRTRTRLLGAAAVVLSLAATDAFACGDKFLVAGRGTRYQRPKTARSASVLIYAHPASGLPSTVGRQPLDSVLKREGHRLTRVETAERLAALLAGGHFDVVLAAASVVETLAGYLGSAPDAPAVVAFCARSDEKEVAGQGAACVRVPAKEGSLLEAIDKAVQQRDRMLRSTRHGD